MRSRPTVTSGYTIAAYNAGPGRAKRWRDVRPLEGAIYEASNEPARTRGARDARSLAEEILREMGATKVYAFGGVMSMTVALERGSSAQT